MVLAWPFWSVLMASQNSIPTCNGSVLNCRSDQRLKHRWKYLKNNWKNIWKDWTKIEPIRWFVKFTVTRDVKGRVKGTGGWAVGWNGAALHFVLHFVRPNVRSGSQWFSVVRCSASVALLHPSPSRSQVTTGQENVTYNWSCCYFTCMFSSTLLIWTYILGGKLVQLAFSGLPTPKL